MIIIKKTNKKTRNVKNKKYRRLGDIWARLAIKQRDNFITNLAYEFASRSFYRKLKKQPKKLQWYLRDKFRGKAKNKKRFAFQVNVTKKQRRKKSLSARGNLLIMRRQMSLFYGGGRIRKKTFRRYGKKIQEYSTFIKNPFQHFAHAGYKTYASLIESRLDVLLLRACFVDSIYTSRNLIINHKSWVQNKGNKIKYPGFLINNFQTFGLVKSQTRVLRKALYTKIKKHTTLTIPAYLFINYPLLLGFKMETPTHLAIGYPFTDTPGAIASFRKSFQLL